MKISLVFLTLNEIVGLREIFDKVPFNEVDEVLAIDGGSNDGTQDFFRERGIPVFVQNKKGRGEAFRFAFRKAKGEALLFFSPDGNEDAADIPKFKPLLEQGNDIVIATRMVEGAYNEEDHQFFKWRKWANRAFTFIANTIWNNDSYITDTINGFRAVKKDVFKVLNIDANGFLVEYQMSIRAIKLGLKVAEIPTIEGPRIGGQSTAKSIPTGLKFLCFLLRELKIGKNF